MTKPSASSTSCAVPRQCSGQASRPCEQRTVTPLLTDKGDPPMRRNFLPIAIVLALAGAALAGPAATNEPGKPTVPAARSARRPTPPQAKGPKVYEGRIKDVRPVW